MESNVSMSFMVQKPLIFNELTQAKELLQQLESQLDAPSTNGKLLIPEILSFFNNSLSMLRGINSEASNQSLLTGSATVVVVLSDSPSSSNGSPRSNYQSDVIETFSRKRKTLPRWTEQVRVCEHTGLEGPLDDGYSWRKYGQKDILEAIYPRSYYRCTHRNAQGCSAMKQIQRSDEDSSMFSVTYRGRHTCIQAPHLLPGQLHNKPEQQDEKRPKRTQETIISFATAGCHEKTEDSGTAQVIRSPSFSFPNASSSIPCITKESHSIIFSSMIPDNHFMTSPFSSPSSSETNSFAPYTFNNFEGDLTSKFDDLYEFSSAATSTFDSQDYYLDLDFLDCSNGFDFPFHT